MDCDQQRSSILGTAARLLLVVLGIAACGRDSTVPRHATALELVTSPPSQAQSGMTFTAEPTIQLLDQNGASFSQGGVTITATIASGGGTLAGTLQQTTDIQGRAT